MVRVKNKKAKPKKQRDAVKKHGMQADIAELCSQLDALGLKIIQVTADGNCFFRALADQLEGSEEGHKKYRIMVVQYISNHQEDFEPFIEDDVPFDEYCQLMEKDGTWAGHMELQAASLVTGRNICIHRAGFPRWYINNFSGHVTNMIHLSYHDGEHYNSVRLKEDSCEGPAKPIIIKVDANIYVMSNDKKVTVHGSKRSSGKFHYDDGSVKLVMAGTGCENIDKVEQVLQEVHGDVDAAIEYLIAEQESNDYNDDMSCEDNFCHGDSLNDKSEHSVVLSGDINCEPVVSSTESEAVQDRSIQHDDKKLPRNKDCPCGSKKKYKAHCGSAMGKSSASTVIGSNSCATKGRKKTKQSRKKEALEDASGCGSGHVPDMGALCI